MHHNLVDFEQQEGKYFKLNISIPGNTLGKVFIPVISENYYVVMDGKEIPTERKGKYCVVEHVNPGKHTFSIIATQ